MSQTLSLYRLQQTDTRMERASARVMEIQKIIENDETLLKATEKSEEADKNYREACRVLHMAENAVKDQRLKLEQNEASLYSGAVKNPKELQDLQNEVAALKRHLATLEDCLLEAMLSCDEVETLQRECSQTLEQERQRVAEQNSGLAHEMVVLAKEKDNLAAERLATTGSIAENLLGLYEDLRKKKRGVAVSLVVDNACGICGATLPPAQAQAARSNAQIIHCPTCGRILYGN